MSARGRVAALLLVLAGDAASAAGIDDCVALTDPAQRLACYDRAAGRAEPASAPVPARAPPTDFGRPPVASPDTEVLEARIAGEFKQWRKGTRIALDNGQVWRATGDETAYYPRLPPNPAVTIRKGPLGGAYWMELKDVGRKLKVQRIS